MKVLALNGSPNTDGGTYSAIRIIADQLEKQDIQVEVMQIGSQAIQGCLACRDCKDKNKCIYDDIVNECIEKSKTVDGIILGSPVYYAGIAGNMKSFLDRFFYAGPDLKYKVGACVAVERRAGGVEVFQQLNNYLNLANVILTPSQYWNVVHGSSMQELLQDKEGVQILTTLGQNMAWLLNVVNTGKSEFQPPRIDKKERTNFIR